MHMQLKDREMGLNTDVLNQRLEEDGKNMKWLHKKSMMLLTHEDREN